MKMGIKNVFKWRVTTNKYLYLTDEENQAPFILDKRTGDRTYPQPISGSTVTGTTVITGMTLDEGLISQTVSKIKSADSYSEKYDKMVELVPFDNDASKLTFLEYDKYFNLDGDECVEEAVTPKCEGYEPVFNVSAYTLQNSGETEVEYSFYAERNEVDKTLRYNLDLGIPRGEKGEKGEDGIGCKGDKGDDGLDAIISNVDADVTVIDPYEEPSVEVVSSKTGDNEYELNFNFRLPRGEQGEEGPVGYDGEPGWDAVVNDITTTTTELAPGSTPYAVIPSSSITVHDNTEDKVHETSFRIDFGLPTGLQGIQGNDGLNAEIRNVTARVIETLEPGYWDPNEYDENRRWIRNNAEAGVTVTPDGGGNVVDLDFWFKIPRGDKGDTGGTGSGGTGDGGWIYNFIDPQFTPTPGLQTPIGDWDLRYHPLLGEVDVYLQIYYPEDWGGGGGSTYYEGNNISIDSGNTISARGYEWNETKLSFAEGENQTNEASGSYSHAEGSGTTASNTTSHAEGFLTEASGTSSHAEGNSTTAAGNNSHVEGEKTLASGESSHAEGNGTIASGDDSHAEGSGTTANGDYSHAEGNGTTASGDDSHAEGSGTTSSNEASHAEGMWTTASGLTSHAEGFGTTASGDDSHAEGYGTIAIGEGSHAEGGHYNSMFIGETTARGDFSHAEGLVTMAIGIASHSEGTGDYELPNGSPMEVVFTPTELDLTENNAVRSKTGISFQYKIPTDPFGDIIPPYFYNGNIYSDSGYTQLVSAVKESLTTEIIGYTEAIYFNVIPSGSLSTAQTYYWAAVSAEAYGDYSHQEGQSTRSYGKASHAEGYKASATGVYSHAEGIGTQANGDYSHAEGNSTISSGRVCHTEGNSTIANGYSCHAEGSKTIAISECSHAEGYRTTSSNEASHAEGNGTTASGNVSHAEGYGTTASGYASHAGGIETIANQSGMTAIGRYNSTAVGNIGGTNLFVVGNGTSSGTSNAFAVTTNGISTPLLNLSSGATLNGGGGRIDFGNINSNTNKSDYYIECGVGQDHTLKLYSYNDNISLSAGNNVNITSTGDGNVNIKTNNGDVRITGNTYCSGVYYAASDARKKNIVSSISLETAYELVEKCQTIFYTWKNKENKKQEIGLLAQEVRNYFPELVSEGSDGYLSLDYSRLTVVLMAVIRDLTQKVKKIDALEEKIKLLEDKLK